MDDDLSLRQGVAALQAGMIDSSQFLSAWSEWTARGTGCFADVLGEHGWIDADQRSRLDRMVTDDLRTWMAEGPRRGTHADETIDLVLPVDDDRATARPDANASRIADALLALPPEGPQSASGRYTLMGLHATGGIGRVWLARDEEIGREVALKELRPEWADNATTWARFMLEARVTGQLEHPGIVPVYALSQHPGERPPFYTMRFVKGRTLHDATVAYHLKRAEGRQDPMDLLNLLSAFVAVCNTVAYAHSRGVIHRDLKGQNVVLGDFGEVVVLDWGLAKLVGSEEISDGVAADLPPGTGGIEMTMLGQAMGTPAYMAPEQATGRVDLIDERTDVYGLGSMLYEILRGRPPFSGGTTQEVIRRVSDEAPPSPRSLWPEVPPVLEAACLRAMEKEREKRYPNATELAHEVQIWQDVQRQAAEDNLRQAYERLMRQQRALVTLTNSSVFAGHDINASFRQLIETAAEVLEVERVSLWRFTPDRRAIRCSALYERSERRHSSGAELTAETYPSYFEALATSDVIAADDAQMDPRTREFTEGYLKPLGIGAMMDVPIPPDTMLCNEHIGPPRVWRPDEQMFAIAVAHLAAHAISQWEREEAVAELKRAIGSGKGS